MPNSWHSANLDSRWQSLPDAAFCRALGFAECLTLGKEGLCRVFGFVFFAKCDTW
jgi:hypothetical protein